MFYLISWIVFGLIVGAIAQWIVPGEEKTSGLLGWFFTTTLGIAGATLGGCVGHVLEFIDFGPYSLHHAGWFMSIVGAVVCLVVYKKYFEAGISETKDS